MKTINLKDSITGAYLGMAIGETIGIPYKNHSRLELEITPVTADQKPRGTWSENTALCIATADALKKTDGSIDIDRIAENFKEWFDDGKFTCTGRIINISPITKEAIMKLKDGVSPEKSGGGEVYDNGGDGISRIMPVCFLLASKTIPIGERLSECNRVEMITHTTNRCTTAAFLYMEYLSKLINEEEKFKAYRQTVKEVMGANLLPLSSAEKRAYARVSSGELHLIPKQKISSKSDALSVLQAGVWCFLTTDSFEEAIMKAVNLGETTDTICAITGALAGTYYGAGDIPSDWLKELKNIGLIKQAVEELSSVCNSKKKKGLFGIFHK